MIKRLAILLILGVLTTVVVAWGLWLEVNVRNGNMVGSLRWEPFDSWAFWVFDRPGATLVQRVSTRGEWKVSDMIAAEAKKLPRWSAVRRRPNADELRFTGSIVEDARGWPFLSLYSESRIPPRTIPMPNNTAIVLQQPFERGSLPDRPIWSGFLADSAIFAAAWTLLLIAPKCAMHQLRRHRGACLACGYDLRFTPHSTNCPECGAELNAARSHES